MFDRPSPITGKSRTTNSKLDAAILRAFKREKCMLTEYTMMISSQVLFNLTAFQKPLWMGKLFYDLLIVQCLVRDSQDVQMTTRRCETQELCMTEGGSKVRNETTGATRTSTTKLSLNWSLSELDVFQTSFKQRAIGGTAQDGAPVHFLTIPPEGNKLGHTFHNKSPSMMPIETSINSVHHEESDKTSLLIDQKYGSRGQNAKNDDEDTAGESMSSDDIDSIDFERKNEEGDDEGPDAYFDEVSVASVDSLVYSIDGLDRASAVGQQREEASEMIKLQIPRVLLFEQNQTGLRKEEEAWMLHVEYDEADTDVRFDLFRPGSISKMTFWNSLLPLQVAFQNGSDDIKFDININGCPCNRIDGNRVMSFLRSRLF